MPWAVAAAAITTAGTVYGVSQNRKTAKEAIAAEKEAAATENQSLDRMIDLMIEGVNESRGIYQDLRDTAAPGVDYTRKIFSEPNQLTPAQRDELDSLRRRATNSAQVAGSALRGSGRSFVTAMDEIESRYINRALAENEARRDRAAQSFATPYFNSLGAEASAVASLGRDVGEVVADQGRITGDAGRAAADISGSARASNTDLILSGVGDVFGTIRGQYEKPRASSYATSYPTQTVTQGSSGGMGVDKSKLY